LLKVAALGIILCLLTVQSAATFDTVANIGKPSEQSSFEGLDVVPNVPPRPDVYCPKLIPEAEMPQPYFLKYGQLPAFKHEAEERTWLEMLTKLGLQVSGPDVSFPFWGTLVVSHGVGADGCYWIWIERGKVSEVNSSVVAAIVEFVNRPAKEIGFMTEVSVKFAEATGSGGVDAASTDS